MKSPSPESLFKLNQAIRALLRSEELMGDEVSETHELIDEVLETVGQVERECEFPERAEIIEFFAKRYAEEEKNRLVQRVVAMVGILSREDLYSSYEAAREMDRKSGS